jgi:hypothetical protein
MISRLLQDEWDAYVGADLDRLSIAHGGLVAIAADGFCRGWDQQRVPGEKRHVFDAPLCVN